ncbi:MAG: flagellar hook-length control protein FliK [Lachnospiraceae bacterium]|nr:flagellar hook-length control protein FliK [Lachnospiraceae bacterium]
MKAQGIMSPVQNGQVVKKTRSTSSNAPNDLDFMSVMNYVSLNDIATGAKNPEDKGYRAEKTSTGNQTKTETFSVSKTAVKVSSSYKTDSDKRVFDSAKTSTTSTKATKKTDQKTKTSDNAVDDSRKAVTKKSSERTDADDTKVKDKNTKTAGPETEDDEVERPEAANDLISDILKTLSEDLGVSENDITDAMNTLGLSFSDLSTPSNVAELFTTLTGTDQNSLLTSDDFMSLLNDIQEIFSGVDDDLMSQLTPVTDEEADELSDLLNVNSDQSPVEDQTDVTVISVETEETVTVTDSMATDDVNTTSVQNQTPDQAQQDDQNTDQPLNGTIVNQTAQDTAGSETQTSGQGSELFGNTEQKSSAEQVNVNALASEGTAAAASDVEVTDFVSTIQKYTDINTDNLISQIVDKAKQTLSSRVSSLEMELHPQSLGKIFLQVTEKSGDVTAHLYAQNEAVKHALENRLQDLQENLNRQGVRVNEVTISVEPHAFEENLEKNMANQFGQTPDGKPQTESFGDDKSSQSRSSRSSIDIRDGVPADDLTQGEVLEAQIMQDNGNTVSYRI